MESSTARAKTRKTILVVDDDPDVLRFVSKLLTVENYEILSAGSGADALTQSHNYKGEISLLLSDFQMPGMTGVDLATALVTDRPDLKVLLMSGFSGGMLILNEGWHFLAKPFIASQLRALVVGLVFPDRASGFAN